VSKQKRGKEEKRRTLDLRDVQEASGVTDHATTGEGQLRNRLETSLVERASTVSDAFSALEQVGKERVVLEALWVKKH
jgi:hypothetical protein